MVSKVFQSGDFHVRERSRLFCVGECRGGWREEERERLDHTSVGYTCDTGGCILRFSSFLLSEMKKVGGGSFVLREKHPREHSDCLCLP